MLKTELANLIRKFNTKVVYKSDAETNTINLKTSYYSL